MDNLGQLLGPLKNVPYIPCRGFASTRAALFRPADCAVSARCGIDALYPAVGIVLNDMTVCNVAKEIGVPDVLALTSPAKCH